MMVILKNDNKDIYKIFPHSAADLKPLFNYLKEIEDRESFSIYKLEVDFGIFRILYDDDSFLSITGQFSNKEEFETINSIYMQIYSIIQCNE